MGFLLLFLPDCLDFGYLCLELLLACALFQVASDPHSLDLGLGVLDSDVVHAQIDSLDKGLFEEVVLVNQLLVLLLLW